MLYKMKQYVGAVEIKYKSRATAKIANRRLRENGEDTVLLGNVITLYTDMSKEEVERKYGKRDLS